MSAVFSMTAMDLSANLKQDDREFRKIAAKSLYQSKK
jgi:hypothetical protein